MALNWQSGTLLAVGLAVGVTAGVIGVMSFKDGREAESPAAAQSMGAAPGTAAPTPTVASPVSIAAGECDQSPILGRKGEDDGRASLQARPAGATPAEVSSLILSGKEAAAAGRQRDAEVLFLNACRNAALLQADALPLADSVYQLARHYATVAAFGAQPAQQLFERAERLYSVALQTYSGRYGASHEKTRFAQEGLKTVQQVTGRSGPVAPIAKAPAPAPAPKAAPQAAPAVAAAPAPAPVAAAPAPSVAAAPAPAPSVATPARAPTVTAQAPAAPPPVVRAPPLATPPAVATARPPAPAARSTPPVAAARPPAPVARSTPPAATPPVATPPAIARARTPAPVPAPQERRQVAAAAAVQPAPAPQARRTNPSFDCARARSTTEKLICADEDLARQDRELGGMHQRARQAAVDPRAFQRESDAKWQQRENTCRDRECLQRWYAQRRAELAGATVAPRPAGTEPGTARTERPEGRERTETTERAQPTERIERAQPTERTERAQPVERNQPTERTATPAPAQRPAPAAEPTARTSPPERERRESTRAAGAGAEQRARSNDDEPVTRAPVVRSPPMRARVAEPGEQPPQPPGTAAGSVGNVPTAEGSPNADR